jgi:hypothetical protein
MSLFVLVGVLITAGSLLYVFYPLLESGPFTVDASNFASPMKRLIQRQQTTLRNMKDLEFEFRMGKLSEEDYRKLEQDYSRQIDRIQGEIESLKPGVLGKTGTPQIVSVVKNKKKKG